MNWNYDDEDDHSLERQRDIEAAEAAAVDEMFASMRKQGGTTCSSTVGNGGWFIPPLADMHIESIQVGDRFSCEPRLRDQDPTDVPLDHPFRAILGVLYHAAARKQQKLAREIWQLCVSTHLLSRVHTS